MNLDYPYQFDGRGRTAEADDQAYIRGLIEQVLFTAPGERVMRPDFGSGLMQLVFAPNSLELAAATQFLVQGALQQWLGNLIALRGGRGGGDRCDAQRDRALHHHPHTDERRRRPSNVRGRSHDLPLLRRAAPRRRSPPIRRSTASTIWRCWTTTRRLAARASARCLCGC